MGRWKFVSDPDEIDLYKLGTVVFLQNYRVNFWCHYCFELFYLRDCVFGGILHGSRVIENRNSISGWLCSVE